MQAQIPGPTHPHVHFSYVSPVLLLRRLLLFASTSLSLGFFLSGAVPPGQKGGLDEAEDRSLTAAFCTGYAEAHRADTLTQVLRSYRQDDELNSARTRSNGAGLRV